VTEDDEPLLTTGEVAAWLGGSISEITLRVWRHRSTGPAWIRVGRGVRYRREAVRAWLDSNEHAGRKAS
jgi:predicted DNA-binding transcriptional regulator AlpA